jgi:putative membrane protein
MMFGMILGWGAVVALALWALTTLFPGTGNEGSPQRGRTPLDILNGRYARGEIGREEYELIKQELSNQETH